MDDHREGRAVKRTDRAITSSRVRQGLHSSSGALVIEEKVVKLESSTDVSITFQGLQGEAVGWVVISAVFYSAETFQDKHLAIKHYCVHRFPHYAARPLGPIQFYQIPDSAWQANSDESYDNMDSERRAMSPPVMRWELAGIEVQREVVRKR
ncbi:hypothetical protein EV421DRAFT_1742610 [Armillaria borealis]|uniref:Uncharacterized protein n=1 Tax=Armillaria borealis TaxID=47425 RepID=A0AA39J025_9AGAR|nr:hypothetical protein EV421DRAFT_1742610 [Armillaria borealis]